MAATFATFDCTGIAACWRDLTFNLKFQRDEESGWFAVHVVELPGCVSQGATIDQAKANIANALESYMEVLLETAIRNQATRESSLPVESNGEHIILVSPAGQVLSVPNPDEVKRPTLE